MRRHAHTHARALQDVEASQESENASAFKKQAETAEAQSLVLVERVKDLQARVNEASSRAAASAAEAESARAALTAAETQLETVRIFASATLL
jgi:hypothetical protein